MSTEGIITIIITFIIGIPSLITLFRINQTKIVYLEKQLINLQDDLLKNFEELSIKYKGVEVEKNIYFISGFLVCQGKKDVEFKQNNIEIYLSDNSKWLDFKIVSNSRGMQIENSIYQERVELNFDLFKSKEFTEYEGIIEVNDKVGENLNKPQLDFHHRIPNLQKIKRFDIEKLKSGLVTLITSCLIAILPLYIAYDYNKIDAFDLQIYNAVTDEELGLHLVLTNDIVEELQNKIISEKSGFELLLDGKTENYPVQLSQLDGTAVSGLTSIYFKMNSWGVVGWGFSVFLLVLFVVALKGIVTSITLFYYQKRYLNLIKQ